MDRNTENKSCYDIALCVCRYISCQWLSINVLLFFRLTRRWDWRPTFSNCLKFWINYQEDKRNLKKSDAVLERTQNVENPVSNLKYITRPIRGITNPFKISVARAESINSYDAKEVLTTIPSLLNKDNNNYNEHHSNLMETVTFHVNDDYSDEETIKKEIVDGKVSSHEDNEMGVIVIDVLTNNEKFFNNLKANLKELAKLREGVKLWIDQDSQKIYSDNRYVGQSLTRSFSGQTKSKTIQFIQRTIDTAILASMKDEEITELIENAKPGIIHIKNTYLNQSWYAKYDEVKILEQLIVDMGWKSD
jgi:hypothetical protein